MRRAIKIFAGLILILAVSVVSCRSAITRPIIFPAPKFKLDPELPGGKIITARGLPGDAHPAQGKPGTSVSSGERTAYGYYAPGGKKLVVFFHGNGEVMGSMQDLALMMLRAGTSVLMAEYPGYGYAAQYKVSEANIYADSEALLRVMGETYGHRSEDIVLWGFSLGTGVAVEMAARKLGQRLVLMAPLTSASAAARHHFFFAAAWLVTDDFNNKAKAPGITYPVLIIHGDRDSVIPFTMGKELAGLFPNAEMVPVAGADHNNLFERIDSRTWQKIVAFAGSVQ